MKTDAPINLKRFMPEKANKNYLLKIIFYVVLLLVLGRILLYQTNKLSVKTESKIEIEGVQIEYK